MRVSGSDSNELKNWNKQEERDEKCLEGFFFVLQPDLWVSLVSSHFLLVNESLVNQVEGEIKQSQQVFLLIVRFLSGHDLPTPLTF